MGIPREICCFAMLSFLVSCAPTMKDFPKLSDDLKSSDEMTRNRAASEMGKIREADSIVLDSLIDCAHNDKSIAVRSACVYSLFSSVGANGTKDETTLKILKDFMISASCRMRKDLYYIAERGLPRETRKELEDSYGNCIRAANFCEYCGEPAVGWCTMRYKFVCNTHRYFQQGGVHWRCP